MDEREEKIVNPEFSRFHHLIEHVRGSERFKPTRLLKFAYFGALVGFSLLALSFVDGAVTSGFDTIIYLDFSAIAQTKHYRLYKK